MSIITFIIVLAVIGLLLWAVNTYIPMPPGIKKALNIAVVVAIVIWILQLFFGVLDLAKGVRIG
jgi:hypothetical protein